MRHVLTLFALLLWLGSQAQSASIRGQVQEAGGAPAAFANVILYTTADSSLYKAQATDGAGLFNLRGIAAGNYHLKATYIGAPDLWVADIQLEEGGQLDLGKRSFSSATFDLTEATVTASRTMVEVKPDRTIFNVEGTINSAGSDAISLLRIERSPAGAWRAYFFNPNSEGRQNWGQGIQPSVSGNGELHGESSLPVHQFVSRVYAFHYSNLQLEEKEERVPEEPIAEVEKLARESWGRKYIWNT